MEPAVKENFGGDTSCLPGGHDIAFHVVATRALAFPVSAESKPINACCDAYHWTCRLPSCALFHSFCPSVNPDP